MGTRARREKKNGVACRRYEIYTEVSLHRGCNSSIGQVPLHPGSHGPPITGPVDGFIHSRRKTDQRPASSTIVDI